MTAAEVVELRPRLEPIRLGAWSEDIDLSSHGVVADVIAYLEAQCPDATPAMRAWCALEVCGAALGTKVYAKPWGRMLRANLFLMIVAPSGAGKGEMLGAIEDLYRAALPGHLLPDRFSSAGLSDALRRAEGYGLMIVDEGDELLKRSRMDAFADTVGMLCRSYDGRATREAIRSRSEDATAGELGPVAPSLVVAIQPSSLQAGVIDTSHVMTGLVSRAVLVSADRPRARVLINEAGGSATEGQVVAGLRRMAGLVGWARLNQTAYPGLEQLKRSMEREQPTDELGGAWSRVPALGVKVATILQASRQAGDGVRSGAPDPIGFDAMQDAMNLALWSWYETQRIFGQDVATTTGEGKLQRVKRAIANRGGHDVPSGEVLKALSGVSAFELRNLLETLEARGEVSSRTPESNAAGRRPKLLSLTEGTGHATN